MALRRPVRALLIAAALVIALTVASVPLLNLSVYSPARTVAAYFDALAAGDAAAARAAIGSPELPVDAPPEALVDAVLDNAPSVPTQVRVRTVSRTGGRAVVEAVYNLSDATERTRFTLSRGPALWGLYDRWLIDLPAWAQLKPQVSGASSADINGVAVPTGQGPIPVFAPMSYTIGFNADYLTSPGRQVTLAQPGAEASVALEPEPTAALTGEVSRRIEEHLAGCVQARTLMPTGCTFGYETDNEILGPVTWRLVRAPEVRLRSTGSRLSMAPAEGLAEVSGRYRDAVTGFAFDFTEQVPFTLGAEIIVTDADVQVKPNSGAELSGGG